MGKRSKQGSALRAKKRAKIANQQLEHALADQSELHRAQSKKDEELFILDTNRKDTFSSMKAASIARKSAAEKEALKKQKYEHSANEKRRINLMLKRHGKEGVIALAEEGKARMEGVKKTRKQISVAAAAASKPTFDLWGEPTASSTKPTETIAPTQQPTKQLSNKEIKARNKAKLNAPPQLAVEVAHPGQSYHPDKEHHQDAIGEALSIEIRRNEAEEYKSRPISEGMSAFTKDFIVNSDSEEDESSSDEEEGEGIETTSTKIIKRKEKLTRAQRNKQKRVKAELTSIKERKQHKQFLHQVNEVHVHNKAVKKAEHEQRAKQMEIAKLKQEKKSIPLGKDVWTSLSSIDPIRAPSLPVALTEELHGGGNGLRTVKPKGSLVTDRLESMAARNMISKKKTKGRRIVQGKRRSTKRHGEKGTEYLLI